MLNGLRVIVSEPEGAFREALIALLADEGADVRIHPPDPADGWKPSALVLDIPRDGENLSGPLAGWLAHVPAVGMTTSPKLLVGSLTSLGFRKVLLKPFEVGDLVVAIINSVPVLHDSLRTTLARANAETSYRYTALFRFDAADALTSVWTFDRMHPASDEFPLDMRVEDSYCRLVRDSDAPFVVTDASNDARVSDHPKRAALRAYCGVPVRTTSGATVGSLCHFDPEPRPITPAAVEALERESERLAPYLVSKRSRPLG